MNAYVVDSTITRPSDSIFHTSVHFGNYDPRPDEDISKFDEEEESMEDKYKSEISKLEVANKQLSVRLKEEFENSKKNINDECTLIVWVWGEKRKISTEKEFGRKQIKLYSVSEPSIFNQIHEFYPWGLWDCVYLQNFDTNKCIYDHDKMLNMSFEQRLNTIKTALRNLSNTTIVNVYINASKGAV